MPLSNQSSLTERETINGQSAEIEGGVFLKNCTTKAQIHFSSTIIKGQFNCIGAHLADKNRYALSLFRAKIEGGIILHPITKDEKAKIERPFIADGGITIAGSKIGGLYAENVSLNPAKGEDALKATNLEVTGPIHLSKSKINGEVRFAGSKISGNLDFSGANLSNENGHALNAQRIKVDQRLIWKNVNIKQGAVSLNGAHVAELDDDPENWPSNADALLLDGFTYDRIHGKVSTSPDRDAWLKNGSLYKDQFFPQPYTQYAKFLRETCHDSQARKILLERETLVRKYERSELSPAYAILRRFTDSLQRRVVGFGHAPFRSIVWLFALWLTAVCLSHKAWDAGDFAPTSAVIQSSEEWQTVAASDDPNPAQTWSTRQTAYGGTTTYAAGQDWSTFNSFAYAADLVIPIINLGQTDTWGPSTERGDWGRRLWRYGFFLQIAGWIVTALGAAAITGIIRRD